ncbi:MAG: hypothetical protein NT007_10730 [Candidatus Kapabacteria bacterium]|nr:hypothetical protein [Candidatus Kapabacteria bacterium]
MKNVIIFFLFSTYTFFSCESSISPDKAKIQHDITGKWTFWINPFFNEYSGIDLVITLNNDSIIGTSTFWSTSPSNNTRQVYPLTGIYQYPDLKMDFGNSKHAEGKLTNETIMILTVTNNQTKDSLKMAFNKQ